MSHAVENWLERMRSDRQRPMVRLLVNRDGRTPAYAFDVDEETDLDELAGRIDSMSRNAGFRGYELHAVGSDGRTIESEKIDFTPPVPTAPRRKYAPAEDVLAFRAMLEAGRMRSECLATLQAERCLLLDERRELRRLLLRLEELKLTAATPPKNATSIDPDRTHRRRAKIRHQ